MGATVVMITTSPEKGKDAMRLGADDVLVSVEKGAMKRHARSFDFLLNTVPVGHDLNPYAALLRRDGCMVLVGALTALEPALLGISLINGRRSIAGSSIGGIPETASWIEAFSGAYRLHADSTWLKSRLCAGQRSEK